MKQGIFEFSTANEARAFINGLRLGCQDAIVSAPNRPVDRETNTPADYWSVIVSLPDDSPIDPADFAVACEMAWVRTPEEER